MNLFSTKQFKQKWCQHTADSAVAWTREPAGNNEVNTDK